MLVLAVSPSCIPRVSAPEVCTVGCDVGFEQPTSMFAGALLGGVRCGCATSGQLDAAGGLAGACLAVGATPECGDREGLRL